MTEAVPIYVLRDMPGVMELEARGDRIFSDKDPSWHPEYPGLYDHISEVAKALFGIDAGDVQNSDAEGMIYADDEAWEPVIELLESAGWDLTDGRGTLLRTAEWFLPMIVLVMDGKMGRLPSPATGGELGSGEAAKLADKLQAEAAKWRNQRRGR